MSAVTVLSREVGPDGIRRYRTTVKVVVHSHNSNNPIDISNSIVRFGTNKMLKSVGSLQLGLTAERNWLNLIYPNDHINFYVNRGDGQGWTRLFYGFVDSIEESYSVDANGVPLTVYSLTCSDFQKAVEKTQIYFNPHVASRADFNGGFIGTPNIGGLGLMTRGVAMNGNPADLVINIMLLLMGFGTQFLLPTSYNPRLADRIRQQRADFILNRLSSDARQQILQANGYANFLEQLRQDRGLSTDVTTLTSPDDTSADAVQQSERDRLREAATGILGSTGSGIGEESTVGGRERGVEAYNILNTTLTGYPPSLLDVLDVFTFVERTAIDGYTAGAPVWERQGNVMSFLNFMSNEVVNELFFDLRPISRDGGLTAGTDFSRDHDEIEGNIADDDTNNGIQYAPAIIMREYPFSSIDRLDASDISLTVRATSGATEAAQETLGLIYFGAIYSDQPNIPGRHVVYVPNMNVEDLSGAMPTKVGPKHLDVAVVHDNEISSSKFTRSDADHYNLFEFYSDAVLGEDARFFMQDLLPIITPIHIVRHGLRVRSLQTRFGRFTLETVNRTQPQPQPADTTQDEAPAPPAVSGTTRLPIDEVVGPDGHYTQGFISSNYGYRNRPYALDRANPTVLTPFRPFNQQDIVPRGNNIWRFHNGADFAAPVGTPVYAVRDGWVVCASPARNVDLASGRGAPTPGFNGYGGTVIIYHDGDSPASDEGTIQDGAMFTLYAHLRAIEPRFVQGTSENARTRMARELRSDGTYVRQRVHAGDKIGEVGCTGFVDRSMAPHLHFETLKKQPSNPRVYPSMNQRLTPDVLTTNTQLASNGGWAPASTPAGGTTQVSASQPGLPDSSRSVSQNPVDVLAGWGLTTHTSRDTADPDTVATSTDPATSLGTDGAYDGDADELVPTAETPPVSTPVQADTAVDAETTQVVVGHVDTPSTRRQIARWALLNDHWYQHNLEYISGTIDMRGAPEIRVGYRLDLVDRNLSFYVEGVSHNWQILKPMTTTLHVTRGQPSNPYPSYVLPFINGFDPTGTQRQTGSRLATYFIVPDPISVRRATKLERQSGAALTLAQRTSEVFNTVDTADQNGTLKDKYNEQILASVSQSSLDLAQGVDSIGDPTLTGAGSTTSAVQTNPQGGIDSSALSEAFDSFGSPTTGLA